MCGIGVTSLIEVTISPACCKALTAVSLPWPGPHTLTATSLMPRATAFSPTLLQVICAAKGVPFLVPLKPCEPEVDHTMVPPLSSVTVTIVLLNEQLMCTTPWAGALAAFFFALPAAAGAAVVLVSFLISMSMVSALK